MLDDFSDGERFIRNNQYFFVYFVKSDLKYKYYYILSDKIPYK